VTEWMLKHQMKGIEGITLSGGSTNRMVEAAKFYFEHYREPRFRKMFQEFEETRRENAEYAGRPFEPANVKNLLDFRVNGIEQIMEEYKLPAPYKGMNSLPREYPEGAELVYNQGAYQVVEVKTPEAACQLGVGTSWCTRFPENAKGYLESNPLYLLYKNGKRFGQYYWDVSEHEEEVKDLKNEDIDLPDELRFFFDSLGLDYDTDEEEEEYDRGREVGWHEDDDEYLEDEYDPGPDVEETDEDEDERVREYEEEQARELGEYHRQRVEHQRQMEEEQRRQREEELRRQTEPPGTHYGHGG